MSKFKLNKSGEPELDALEAPPPEPQPAVRTTDVSVERKPDFGRLGTHVGAVLGAAEEAAGRIQHEARADAQRVREKAETEAAELVDAARRDSDVTKEQAEQIRAEAKEWADRTRSETEAYVADIRVQAEANAAEIVARAERQAVAVRHEGERRHQALHLDISHAENRLRDLVTALHGLADRLDGVLSAPVARGGDAETLEEALDPGALAEELKA
jgi:cell division septum initiation protein DivIVA